jgi:hypothetical protein
MNSVKTYRGAVAAPKSDYHTRLPSQPSSLPWTTKPGNDGIARGQHYSPVSVMFDWERYGGRPDQW